MPSRSARNHARKSAPIRRNDDNNNENNNDSEPRHHTPSQQQRQASPPITFTPPTQLPTPLPEEHIAIAQRGAGAGLVNFADDGDGGNARLSQLIDFDTPTPPPALLSFTHADVPHVYAGELASSALSEDDPHGSSTVYRSPPYREARLPDSSSDSSPPPLPVPPRYQHHQQEQHILNDEDGNDGTGMQGGFATGHTRAPTFVGSSISAASPLPAIVSPSPTHSRYTPSTASTFDAFTRTLRGYAPAPSSAGRFAPAPTQQQPQSHVRARSHGYPALGEQEYEREYERDAPPDDGADEYYAYGGYPRSPPPPHPLAPRYGGQQQQHQQEQHQQHQERQQQEQQQPGQQQRHRHSQSVPHAPAPQQARYQAPAPNPPSSSARFMGSGLAQAIRRGAAAGVGVVAGRGAAQAGGNENGNGRRREGEQAGGNGTGNGTGKRREAEEVVWARWDLLNGRRVLLLAYPAGLQMWDCADLGALRERFNLDLGAPEWALIFGGSDLPNAGGHGQQVRVVHAAVLPDPVGGREKEREREKDGVREQRPLLGMLLESADEDEREQEARSVFVVYSLRTHQVVKMRPMPGLASDFKANQNFIVIGTTTPATLHILSSTSFHTLHMITAAHLAPYATPALSHTTSPSAISITNAISSTAQSTSVSLGLSIDTHDTSGKATPDAPPDPPHPVFALHHRLLAFASPSPASSSPSLHPASSASSSSSTKAARRLSASSSAGGSAPSNGGSSLSSSPFALGRIAGLSQADVGHAALRVGESVFSGMRFLGGMALEAAKNRVGAVGPEGRVGAFGSAGAGGRTGIPVAGGQRGTSASPGSTGGGRLVSRSAPDNEGAAREDVGKERRYSNTSNLSAWDQRERGGASGGSTPNSPNPHLTTIAPSTRPVAENGHYVTVLDLAPLLSGSSGAAPTKIDEFNASRSRPVVDLSFAHDGTSVAAVLKDGHTVRVFKLQPTPRVLLNARAAALEAAAVGLDEMELRSEMGRRAAHVYDLYRGRTSAVVEGVEWARDGRWLAMGTRNRTIHVFAINPYGGKGDVRSHMEGRVRNVDVIEPRLTTLHPLVRLRGTKSNAEQTRAPLAFTFISPADVASSPTLMFPFAPPPISNSPTFSPPKLKRAKNYQDLLVFDPVDGVLSLRRLAIDKQPEKEQGIGGVAASVHALGVTSISLPGMGGAGRLSSSPSTRGTAGALSSGRSTSSAKAEEPLMELVAKESVEATWDLKRGRDWVEIKTPVLPSSSRMEALRKNISGGDWLSEGEISTCSNSTNILPRSLYLSHQFSFHTLGEDYHALIRRYQFDISGAKIEVRKAVEISAYASGGGESAFVEGFSSPRDIRRASSSFDEPIASAISGSFDNSNLPTILPMYPNGVPGAKPKSFRNSIPIRTMSGIGDGVSEGIGRLRREMHKTRSPQLVPRPDSLSGPVPLEFDEEDEDFISRDTLAEPTLVHDRGDSSISRDASRMGASADSASLLATPANLSTHHLMDADVVGAMEEDIWDGWDRQDKLAVEEAEQFHDITAIGYVEEEQPQVAVVSDQVPVVKRKGRAKRRG